MSETEQPLTFKRSQHPGSSDDYSVQLKKFSKARLSLYAPTPQNGQTLSKNSSAVADQFYFCLNVSEKK